MSQRAFRISLLFIFLFMASLSCQPLATAKVNSPDSPFVALNRKQMRHLIWLSRALYDRRLTNNDTESLYRIGHSLWHLGEVHHLEHYELLLAVKAEVKSSPEKSLAQWIQWSESFLDLPLEIRQLTKQTVVSANSTAPIEVLEELFLDRDIREYSSLDREKLQKVLTQLFVHVLTGHGALAEFSWVGFLAAFFPSPKYDQIESTVRRLSKGQSSLVEIILVLHRLLGSPFFEHLPLQKQFASQTSLPRCHSLLSNH